MPIETTVARANLAQTRNAFGVKVEILLRGAATGQQYSSYVCTVNPGDGAPPHRHDGFDEAFYVLEGTLEVLSGDTAFAAETGSFVFLPRGTVHTFRNTSASVARFLGFATPAGHERFFDDVDAISQNGPPSMDDAIRVCRRHGLELALLPA